MRPPVIRVCDWGDFSTRPFLKRGPRDGPGNQMQVTRIGGVAQQPECLASPRRRSLPWHPILQSRSVSISVWRRDLKGHFHEPGVNRRVRELLRMNNSGNTWERLIAGRPLRGWSGTCQYWPSQQCRCGNGELHDVFQLRCIVRDNAGDDPAKQHACGAY